jgi:hypothetical protein
MLYSIQVDRFEGSVTLDMIWDDKLLNMDSPEYMDVKVTVIDEVKENNCIT